MVVHGGVNTFFFTVLESALSIASRQLVNARPVNGTPHFSTKNNNQNNNNNNNNNTEHSQHFFVIVARRCSAQLVQRRQYKLCKRFTRRRFLRQLFTQLGNINTSFRITILDESAQQQQQQQQHSNNHFYSSETVSMVIAQPSNAEPNATVPSTNESARCCTPIAAETCKSSW
jgi:hypothetical protein